MNKKKDITPRNNKGERHGYHEQYYDNGELWYKGNWKDGKEYGYWEFYYDNGKLWYKGNFINRSKDGYWESYHTNGKLIEIEYCIN